MQSRAAEAQIQNVNHPVTKWKMSSFNLWRAVLGCKVQDSVAHCHFFSFNPTRRLKKDFYLRLYVDLSRERRHSRGKTTEIDFNSSWWTTSAYRPRIHKLEWLIIFQNDLNHKIHNWTENTNYIYFFPVLIANQLMLLLLCYISFFVKWKKAQTELNEDHDCEIAFAWDSESVAPAIPVHHVTKSMVKSHN